MTANHITKVAVVGAGGNVGKYITEALISGGKHTVTAITREDSQSKLPAGVEVKKVNYDKPETLVAALQGQEAVIITLNGRAEIETLEKKLVVAANEAGVSVSRTSSQVLPFLTRYSGFYPTSSDSTRTTKPWSKTSSLQRRSVWTL
jgi:saccharopine dehydrogenase-like NADP-dependent oxidoreductase